MLRDLGIKAVLLHTGIIDRACDEKGIQKGHQFSKQTNSLCTLQKVHYAGISPQNDTGYRHIFPILIDYKLMVSLNK